MKPSVSDEEFDQAVWKTEYNWIWIREVEAEEDNPYELVWETEDEQTSIHFIDDQWINLCYFVAKGKEPEKVIEQIRSSLDTYSVHDIHQMLNHATTPEEYIRAIHHVGVAAPQEYEPALVRHAAILAITYVGWSEFKNVLKKMETSDPDPSVRQRASILLEAYSKSSSCSPPS